MSDACDGGNVMQAQLRVRERLGVHQPSGGLRNGVLPLLQIAGRHEFHRDSERRQVALEQRAGVPVELARGDHAVTAAQDAHERVAIAAMPLLVATPASAPSSAAISRAASSTVGLLNRPYHVSPSPSLVAISA